MFANWSYSYYMAQRSLSKGNVRIAFGYASDCNLIISKSYQNVGVREQVILLERLHKTVLLLKSCSEKSQCYSCVEKQLKSGIETFLSLYKSKKEHLDVRFKAGAILLLLHEELTQFYEKQDMKYKLSHLKKTINKNEYKLFVVK